MTMRTLTVDVYSGGQLIRESVTIQEGDVIFSELTRRTLLADIPQGEWARIECTVRPADGPALT